MRSIFRRVVLFSRRRELDALDINHLLSTSTREAATCLTQPASGIGTTDVMLKLDFREDFVGRVTGQAGVIEMRLTERVTHYGIAMGMSRRPHFRVKARLRTVAVDL